MKLFLSIAVYLIIGALLGWGMLLLMKGSPIFLIVAALAYLVAFAKIGCSTH